MTASALKTSALLSPRILSAVFIVSWSTAWIAGKLGLQFTGPLTLLEIRFALAAPVMLLAAMVTHAPWPKRRADYGHLAVAGLLINAVTMVAMYTALHTGISAGVAALIAGLAPLLVALASGPVFGERIGTKRWIGLAIGLLGLALVVLNKLSFGAGHWQGYALTVFALCTFVIATLYQKKFCSAIDVRTGNFVQFTVCAAALFWPALHLEHLRVTWSEPLIVALAWMVLINSSLAISLFHLLLRQGQASRVAMLFYLMPPLTAAMGFVAFHETLGRVALLGFALTATGVYFGSGGAGTAASVPESGTQDAGPCRAVSTRNLAPAGAISSFAKENRR